MNVPLFDLTRQYEEIRKELEAKAIEVLASGRYILGANVEAFEREVAEYLGVKHAVGLNSGTDALLFGLRSLGIGPGDEVITTAFSYFATCEVIGMVGATPVFCDVDYKTFNLDPEDLEKKITPRTKAVIPVHIFGQMCDMKSIMDISRNRGIAVIEDACQAIGASCEMGKAGAVGDVGAFSFFPSKNLGAVGDGGLLTTNDSEIAKTARALRMHGTMSDRYRHEMHGYNSRLDEFQATMLRVKLQHLENFNEKRRTNASAYDAIFSRNGNVIPPVRADGNVHTYHQYTVKVQNGKRDALFAHLQKEGIGCAIYYKIPLHRQPAFGGRFDGLKLPVTEKLCEEVLSLPIFPELKEEERCAVIEAVNSFV